MSRKFEKTEILAPVGGSEQLIAAVRCGANAVYLGAKGFNARRNAENFDASTSLKDAVSYCHARGVRVHVTFNTLITDDEHESAEENLREIAASGADAVIVQDLAVAEMIRRRCPELEMHASTQMAVHNVSGVKALEKLGFTRVVLARELSLEEIRAVCDSTDMEVEAFVHGALCMGASGLCELSAMIGGRSGNRGLCAQPCRLDFRCGKREYALSLKDLSYISHISELENAGICSLKIEGRMKRPEYVAAAVTACRQAINGEKYDLDTLRAVFSRSGFTDGYLTGKRNLDMFGYRTKDDVVAAQGVFKTLAGLYKGEFRSLPVSMALTLKGGEASRLDAECRGAKASAEGAVPEAARTVAMDRETAEKNLGRTGGTQFYLDKLETHFDEGLTVAQSELNRLRRDVLESLSSQLGETKPWDFLDSPLPDFENRTIGETKLRLRFEKASQICDTPEAELIILPAREILSDLSLISRFGGRLAAELPTICYPLREARLRKDLETLKSAGLTRVVADNLYSIELCLSLGFTVHGGASLNILNSVSLREYEKLGIADATVSPELSMARLRAIKGTLPRGVIAYGYLPLMKFRACPVQSEKGCASCTGLTPLRDRKNEVFNVICREKQYSELLNCVPLYVGDKCLTGADFAVLSFTTETKEQCGEIIRLFLSHGAADFRHTGGLYYRELL